MSRTDRPRIGFLSPIWLPRFGGAEQYVHRLALELIARGFDVRAFTQTAERPGRDNGQVPVTRYTEAGEFEFRSLLWRWPGKLEDTRALSSHYAYMQAAVRWVKDNGIDLCILDNGLQQVDFLHARELHMVLKAMGVRRGILHYDLATIVDDELHKIYMEQPGGWRTAGMTMLAKLKSFARGRDAFETALAIHSPLVFAPDFVISCSAWSASFIDPLDSVPKIVVHPLMDGARWGERLGPEKRLRPRSVLMINPQMRKGPEQMRNLIAAAEPSWSFRVLKGGWGDSFATFKPLVEATEAVRQGRVEFLDYLEDLRQAYQSAGVLFFPSLREGYGMTAVEPMYAGTPVVSGNYPAIMEAVGRGAFALCPFKSPPEAWKRAVAEVLANRSEWSARALTRASNLAKRQEEEIVKLTSFLLDVPGAGPELRGLIASRRHVMNIFDNVITDRGSKYAVSGGPCHSAEEARAFLAELKRNKKFAKATHNSWALICGGQMIKNDDGEAGAGMVILRMLEREALADHIVVVTRWFGGKHLGGDRFRHVQDAVRIYLKSL